MRNTEPGEHNERETKTMTFFWFVCLCDVDVRNYHIVYTWEKFDMSFEIWCLYGWNCHEAFKVGWLACLLSCCISMILARRKNKIKWIRLQHQIVRQIRKNPALLCYTVLVLWLCFVTKHCICRASNSTIKFNECTL